MKKILVLITMIIGLSSGITNSAHHWVWQNDDYITWIDDTTIEVNDIRSAVKFDIIMENRRNNTQKRSKNKMVIYKANSDWFFYINGSSMEPHKVSYYSEWWQPYGLRWMIDNGFLY